MYINGSILVALAVIIGSLIEKKDSYPAYLGDVPPEQLRQESKVKDLLILFLLIALLIVTFVQFSKK